MVRLFDAGAGLTALGRSGENGLFDAGAELTALGRLGLSTNAELASAVEGV